MRTNGGEGEGEKEREIKRERKRERDKRAYVRNQIGGMWIHT